MIARLTLRYLISELTRDAKCLLTGGRHKAAIYLMGYAIELALKWRICLTWSFHQGFPESPSELNTYLANVTTGSYSVGIPSNIGEIKNHNLNLLLQYSGVELRIRTNYSTEWDAILFWHPELRYKMQKVSKEKSRQFHLIATSIIVDELL